MRKQTASNKIFIITATLLSLGVAVFFFNGCARIPLNYEPGSKIKVTGNVSVSEFRYLPAQTGKVKPFQIFNATWGNLKFKKDIGIFFRDAVSQELGLAGVNQGSKVIALGGEIEDFLIDDSGSRADWTLKVRYVVKDLRTGEIVYTSVKTTMRSVSKLADLGKVLNEIIKLNIEDLLKDEAFIKTIN